MTEIDLRSATAALLDDLGVDRARWNDGDLPVRTPLTGETIADVTTTTGADLDRIVTDAGSAFRTWATSPAPARGELVRAFGQRLRDHREALADLVTLEAGKIASESLGEVQEMIDMCDLAVGLSRQIGGLTLPSERPGHRLMETWHPLGPVGVITAFNFPVAVWAWNAALALVCGDPVVWKPSEKTPLTALACEALLTRTAEAQGVDLPLHVVVGDRDLGIAMAEHDGLPLVSATGSSRMGADLGPRVAKRFGRSLLELGGNNAATVMPSADLELTRRAVLFAAVGTAGQRCTTLRRLIVHEDIADELVEGIVKAYAGLSIGNPWRNNHVLVGPLIDQHGFDGMQAALERAEASGEVLTGGSPVDLGLPDAYYVEPAVVGMPSQTELVCEETFAPILYVLRCSDLDDAIDLNNGVPQGLSSAIFTHDLREAEQFMGALGSDCGIVNVNTGPSGAEIGGAFGGNKATGGGREAGSDAWKAYMRRATNTINLSDELPLAQGVEFS
ncbi:MAG TPA: aldehyde dehydrogenase family protein [Nitriliruptorales bacterium]